MLTRWASRGRQGSSRCVWLLVLILGLLGTAAPVGLAAAQDALPEAPATTAPVTDAEPGIDTDTEPAAATAPAPDGPAAPVGNGETSTQSEAPRTSMLAYLLKAHSDPLSAFVGLVLLGVSIYFVALVIRLLMEYRVSEAAPPALIDNLETLIKERRFQEAYDVCREDGSFLARLVRTGIANLPTGRSDAKEAMSALAEEIVVTMESKISYLATIGTLGPMIGLVGTVWGMIRAFQEIAMAAGTQPRADQVAGGISTALFITLEGISLSVPAIFFYAFFRNRIAMISMEVTRIADRTILAFYTAAKSGGSAAATSAGSPSAPASAKS